MEILTKSRTNRTALNARFHQLIGQFQLDADEKKLIVRQVSYGLKESTKDLTDNQLFDAIRLLENKQHDSTKRMRAKAINLARELDLVKGEAQKIDWTGLNNFTEKTFKKPFYELDQKQLRDCITALKKWQNHNQAKAVKALLQ